MPLLSYWDDEDNNILPSFAQKSSTVKDILDLLSLSGKLPNATIDKEQRLPLGTSGDYYPLKDQITFHPLTGNTPSVGAHELFHALQARMGNKAYNLNKSWRSDLSTSDLQYLDAYEKLNSGGAIKNQPEEGYRTRLDEAQAFGVGNYATGQRPSWEAEYSSKRPHLDATNASEMAILMDLYKRTFKK